MLINDSPSVEWSKKAYVFNPHARGLVLSEESEESEENILVNLHGLLGEPDAVQIEIASENLEEGSQFVYDNVAYQVTRSIMEDVEHPLVYVMVLDIFADS